MDLEKDYDYGNLEDLQDKCKKCLYYHTILTMTDGSKLDGIIENVEPDRIIVLVGEDVMEKESEYQPDEQRQYHSYVHPRRRRFRRFRRHAFPLASLAGLSLLSYPYFVQPPYPYFDYY